MFYEKELRFLEKIFAAMKIQVTYLREKEEIAGEIDFGLRKSLGREKEYEEYFGEIIKHVKDNCIYYSTDFFACTYLYLKLPDMQEGGYMVVGPYINHDNSKSIVSYFNDKQKLPYSLTHLLERFYTMIPMITEEGQLVAIINSFAEVLWGGPDSYMIEPLHKIKNGEDEIGTLMNKTEEQLQFDMQLIEQRYENERKLMQAISQGLVHKAELSISKNTIVEQRLPDTVRDMKNYSITLNTLLRKAAEAGGVHPFYIDQLSSKFVIRIEQITSVASANNLQREMIRKYALMVKNHSLSGYSPLIKKVIMNIQMDITADLGLKHQAELLNVSPTYLSMLFKKETGENLTAYVNRMRMEHAVLLLNSTNLQIQTVALYCGIPDVNYFTKIFKKKYEVTPKEYRKQIRKR